MKVAIMQPYFLPYIGYFQLINAVDKFVIYDDVNFINRGWINRNNFLNGDKPFLITVPLNGASQNKKINEIHLDLDQKWRKKLLKTIDSFYRNSPHFNTLFPELQEIMLNSNNYSISAFNTSLIHWVVNYLSIDSRIIDSSAHYLNAHLKGEERIINICEIEEATTYINPTGGIELYGENKFDSKGIDLRFIHSTIIPYSQKSTIFVENLSILDYMMYLTKDEIKVHLTNFKLTKGLC